VGILDWFLGPEKKRDPEVEDDSLRAKSWRLPQTNPNLQPVEIVGESFYVDAFKFIRGHLGLKPESTAVVRVHFRAETQNPHTSDGKAVAVYVIDRKVGYVSSRMAADVFATLESQKGSKIMAGQIYFGDLRQKPARNSVSVDWSVPKLVTEESLRQDAEREKVESKRQEREVAQAKFLKNPNWSQHTLVAGDRVTFTGFANFYELDALAISLLSEPTKTGSHLLVVHPSIESTSAKLRDWLGGKRPVTNLETFVASNPNFGKYFNSLTNEFDIPDS
jgi:hypothetical protein